MSSAFHGVKWIVRIHNLDGHGRSHNLIVPKKTKLTLPYMEATIFRTRNSLCILSTYLPPGPLGEPSLGLARGPLSVAVLFDQRRSQSTPNTAVACAWTALLIDSGLNQRALPSPSFLLLLHSSIISFKSQSLAEASRRIAS